MPGSCRPLVDRFRVGDRVRTRLTDPPGHTRLARYVRGQVGTVVDVHSTHPLPDDVAAGVDPPRRETVYTVRFAAADLFGRGDHHVSADLWDSYLRPAEEPRP